jgi:hypothetical protein
MFDNISFGNTSFGNLDFDTKAYVDPAKLERNRSNQFLRKKRRRLSITSAVKGVGHLLFLSFYLVESNKQKGWSGSSVKPRVRQRRRRISRLTP